MELRDGIVIRSAGATTTTAASGIPERDLEIGMLRTGIRTRMADMAGYSLDVVDDDR